MEVIENILAFCNADWKVEGKNLMLIDKGSFLSLDGDPVFLSKKIMAIYGYSLWRWARVEISKAAAIDITLFREVENFSFNIGTVCFYVAGGRAKAEFTQEVGSVRVHNDEFIVYKFGDSVPAEAAEVLPRFSGELVLHMETILQDAYCKRMFFDMEAQKNKEKWWAV